MKRLLSCLLLAVLIPQAVSATSPGTNGDIALYGDSTIRFIDPASGTETGQIANSNYSRSYFNVTSDGQNYLNMFQLYDGPNHFYYSSPLTATSSTNGGSFDLGDYFNDTYDNVVSPDGTKVAYYEKDGNLLTVFNFNTMTAYQYTGVYGYMDLAWSPDNSKIAYFYYNWSNPSAGTYAAYLDLNKELNTTITGLSGTPLDWNPNGRDIAYKDGSYLRVYNTQDDSLTTLNPGGAIDGTSSLHSFSWSPDGTSAAFVTGLNGTYYLNVSDNLTINSPIRTQVIPGTALKVSWTPLPEKSSVYRFWSQKSLHHFYTANFNEAIQVMSSSPNDIWTYEGIAYSVPASCSGKSSVYRFWSPKNHIHFYTISEQEKNDVINQFDDYIWTYEGVAYCANATQATGTIPLYRFYSSSAEGHFFTTNEAEKNYLISNHANTWRFEGIAYYVN